jgi:hypothetical protein
MSDADWHSDPKGSAQRPWTAAELAELRGLASQGLRVAAIALRLKRSYDAVTWKARKEGVIFAAIGARRIAAPDV